MKRDFRNPAIGAGAQSRAAWLFPSAAATPAHDDRDYTMPAAPDRVGRRADWAVLRERQDSLNGKSIASSSLPRAAAASSCQPQNTAIAGGGWAMIGATLKKPYIAVPAILIATIPAVLIAALAGLAPQLIAVLLWNLDDYVWNLAKILL
jgi:hypothetical protein